MVFYPLKDILTYFQTYLCPLHGREPALDDTVRVLTENLADT